MRKLAKLTHQEKKAELRNAIRRKCRYGVSSRQLDCIIGNLNINRAYFIKSTRSSRKFLNLATEEMIATTERKIISFTTLLYGDFKCGRFFKGEDSTYSVPGIMSGNHDAAAVKMTITCAKNEPPSISYMIVLYECGPPGCSY